MSPKSGDELDPHPLCSHVKQHEKAVYNLQDDVRQLQIRAERIEAAIHERADKIDSKLIQLDNNIEQLKSFLTYLIAKSRDNAA